MSRHGGVLEAAALVPRTRDAQRRPAHLEAPALEAMTAWIDTHRRVLEQQYREPDGGRSRLTGHSPFPSQEARDGMLAAGMEQGVTEGYERLDDALED